MLRTDDASGPAAQTAGMSTQRPAPPQLPAVVLQNCVDKQSSFESHSVALHKPKCAMFVPNRAAVQGFR